MQFGDLNWMDVESYLAQDDRVIVITGACEQHSSLSLMTDVRIPTAIAQAATQQEPVLIAPPVNVGVSISFMAYPGTLTLRPETFAAVVRDVLDSLLGHGFRRILVANGHGGNTGPLTALLAEMGHQHEEATFRLYEWWKHPAVDAIAAEAGLEPNHANWLENFAFTRVTDDIPEGEKPTPDIRAWHPPQQVRALAKDGSYGGAFSAPDVVMQALFEASVETMVGLLRDL